MFCSICGNKVNPDIKYCNKCGTIINSNQFNKKNTLTIKKNIIAIVLILLVFIVSAYLILLVTNDNPKDYYYQFKVYDTQGNLHNLDLIKP